MNFNSWMVLCGCLLLGIITTSKPAAAESDSDLRARLERIESRTAELESKEDQSWLNTRRTEEVKSLIHEVLADADTRASLLQGGPTAGHNGQNFYLSNADGSFLLNIGGQIQIRHLWNSRDSHRDEDDSGFDEHERGFEVPRAKVKFWGHIASPRIKYKIVLGVDRDDNEAVFKEVVVSYDLTENLTI